MASASDMEKWRKARRDINDAELKAWEQDLNLQQQRSQLQALKTQLGHLRAEVSSAGEQERKHEAAANKERKRILDLRKALDEERGTLESLVKLQEQLMQQAASAKKTLADEKLHFDAHMREQLDFNSKVEAFYTGQGSAAAQ